MTAPQDMTKCQYHCQMLVYVSHTVEVELATINTIPAAIKYKPQTYRLPRALSHELFFKLLMLFFTPSSLIYAQYS